jgi:hypothetical protein
MALAGCEHCGYVKRKIGPRAGEPAGSCPLCMSRLSWTTPKVARTLLASRATGRHLSASAAFGQQLAEQPGPFRQETR